MIQLKPPTREEVKKRYQREEKGHMLFWEFRGKLYVPALPFEFLRELYNDKVSDEEIREWMEDFTFEKILKEAKEYLKFAYKKAEDEKGISANRSIEHYEVWFYLLGDYEFLTKMKDIEYSSYGLPILKAIEKRIKELGEIKNAKVEI